MHESCDLWQFINASIYIYLSASITVTVTLNIWLGVGRVHAGHWLVLLAWTLLS